MSSTLMSIALRMLPRSGAATSKANSWAVVCLWRRFFEIKQEEEQEKLDVLCEVLEDSIKSPVSTDEARQLRREILQDHYRKLSTTSKANTTIRFNETSNEPTSPSPDVNVMRERESQVMHQPNLDIPMQDGYSYVNVAQ